ncbi:MAG: DUF4258 domain-containing protein [Nanoarchaeota archaeon]
MITVILYSKHAIEKMNALGIERSEVETLIKKGMKWKEHFGKKWHARMYGIECVFEKHENDLYIITVHPEGD